MCVILLTPTLAGCPSPILTYYPLYRANQACDGDSCISPPIHDPYPPQWDVGTELLVYCIQSIDNTEMEEDFRFEVGYLGGPGHVMIELAEETPPRFPWSAPPKVLVPAGSTATNIGRVVVERFPPDDEDPTALAPLTYDPDVKVTMVPTGGDFDLSVDTLQPTTMVDCPPPTCNTCKEGFGSVAPSDKCGDEYFDTDPCTAQKCLADKLYTLATVDSFVCSGLYNATAQYLGGSGCFLDATIKVPWPDGVQCFDSYGEADTGQYTKLGDCASLYADKVSFNAICDASQGIIRFEFPMWGTAAACGCQGNPNPPPNTTLSIALNLPTVLATANWTCHLTHMGPSVCVFEGVTPL